LYEFLSYRVSDVMTRRPEVIGPSTTLAEAEGIFASHNFNGLPVVDARGNLLGMLTKLDLLRAFVFTPRRMVPPYEEIMARDVETVMTRQAHTVSPETPLTRVLEAMVLTRYKSFPVAKDGRLVGIVAREDVLRGLQRAARLSASAAAVPF
jgi:CBS domain-containing protein